MEKSGGPRGRYAPKPDGQSRQNESGRTIFGLIFRDWSIRLTAGRRPASPTACFTASQHESLYAVP